MSAGTWALVGALAGAVLADADHRLEGAAVGAVVGASAHAASRNPERARRVIDATAKVVSA